MRDPVPDMAFYCGVYMEKKFLNEDGSLNIECINKLQIKERLIVISDMTWAQYESYASQIPINEMTEPFTNNFYTLEEVLEKGLGMLADDVMNELRMKIYKND